MTDAWETEWLFEEKVPVVSADELDAQSPYPQAGIIACHVVKKWLDEDGRELATIDTEQPWGVESSEGTTKFDILADQLIEW